MSRKRVIVTTSWDDGFSLKNGKLSALLNDYGINATFYITKEAMRTPEDVSNLKMLDKTFEIGAHTLSHPDLTNISINEAREEIIGSKKWIEQLLNHEINLFAYPYGRHNKELSELIRTSGFIGSRTLNFDITPPKDPFMIGIACTSSSESPRLRLKAALKSKLCFKSLADWETNAKLLFDSILEKGGVWHLWGHDWQITMNNEWDKLEEVFKHISDNPNVSYLTNGQLISLCPQEQ